MPDVVESRKVAAAKQAQIISEQNALNGSQEGRVYENSCLRTICMY